MTLRLKHLFCTAFLLYAGSTLAQEIDNTPSYKNINSDSYFRLTVDNDYFSGKDEEYTEGVNFELVTPWAKKFPLSHALINPHYSTVKYGIGIEQAGFTPDDLGHKEYPVSDRPFAGTLFLKTFLIATDTVRKQRFSTTLSTGVIGHIALGDNIQDVVHKMIGDVVPPGWKYQIANDAIVNYQVNYEKQFLSYKNIFSLDAEGMARAGTLSDKAGIGLNLLLGYFESPFAGIQAAHKDFHIYIYDHPEVDVVGYDATLQGGVFNHDSPYTIPSSAISRLTFMNRAGLVIAYRRVYVEYFQCYLSKEFDGGPIHGWGGVQLAFTLK